MISFKSFFSEAYRLANGMAFETLPHKAKNYSVSAIHYEGKVHHGNGANHVDLIPHVINHHKIPNKDVDDHVSDKMHYGYYDKNTNEYIRDGKRERVKQQDVVRHHAD